MFLNFSGLNISTAQETNSHPLLAVSEHNSTFGEARFYHAHSAKCRACQQLFGKGQRCDSMKYRQYLTRYKISLNLDTKFASRKWTMIRCKLHKPIRCQSYIMKTTLKKNLRITLAPTCYWIVVCPHQIWHTNALPESDNHQEKARLQTTWSLEVRRKK